MSNSPIQSADRRGLARNNRIMVVAGTRPEVIKLAPVIAALRATGQDLAPHLVLTGQHEALADDMARIFDLRVDTHLHEMRAGDDLPHLVGRMLGDMAAVIATVDPALVLVHGDTATTVATALAAFYDRIPVGHVEAGLRTLDLGNPFPEEANRSLVARVATLNFAPTELARTALIREGVSPHSIFVTGNTVVDAAHLALSRIGAGVALQLPPLSQPNLILATVHRRESWGEGLAAICEALRRIVSEIADVEIVLPVHPGPAVHDRVQAELSGLPRLHLVPPMDYLSLIALLSRCRLVLTDSGGIQEEAVALHKPVLVMRQRTERQEAIDAGAAILVGTETGPIVTAVADLLISPARYRQMEHAENPFGDGKAGQRIAEILRSFVSGGGSMPLSVAS